MRATQAVGPLLTRRWGQAFLIAVVMSISFERSDAAPSAADPSKIDSVVWQAVSETRLDTLRGGFDAGGLLVSFGITRAVYVNGALLTETTLNLGQLTQMPPALATQLSRQITGVNVVKIGPANTAALEGGLLPSNVAGALPGVVVQNTLNNQNINVQTVINATSNGMGILRGMNSMRTLNDGVR